MQIPRDLNTTTGTVRRGLPGRADGLPLTLTVGQASSALRQFGEECHLRGVDRTLALCSPQDIAAICSAASTVLMNARTRRSSARPAHPRPATQLGAVPIPASVKNTEPVTGINSCAAAQSTRPTRRSAPASQTTRTTSSGHHTPDVQREELPRRERGVGQDDLALVAVLVRGEETELHRLLTLPGSRVRTMTHCGSSQRPCSCFTAAFSLPSSVRLTVTTSRSRFRSSVRRSIGSTW